MDNIIRPKGQLLIIGGHEDKGEVPGENLTIHRKNRLRSHFEILGTLISKIPRTHHIIEIIPTASSIPEEMEQLYANAYKAVGFTHVGFIKVADAADAANPDYIRRIQNAHAIFFTGGDQSQLVSRFAGTPLLIAISKKYYADEHYIVGGTSAGAMALPETIITGGTIREALYKEDIRMSTGMGLIKNLIVDTHFIKRGRFARLAHAVALHQACIGVGLEEDTALIIKEGYKAECIGSGMVVVIDGTKITATNAATVNDTTPIVMDNLRVSILAEGSCYNFSNPTV